MDRLLMQMKMSGWCVVEKVIPPDKIEQIRASVIKTTDTHRRAGPFGVGFVPGVINYDQSFAPYLADERLTERAILEKGTGQTDNEVPGLPRAVFEQLPETVQPLYGHWVI
jgi:hypothetical protein